MAFPSIYIRDVVYVLLEKFMIKIHIKMFLVKLWKSVVLENVIVTGSVKTGLIFAHNFMTMK